ncbi:MAG: hypothetical protein ABR601_00475 [Parasphingopyxis sp.]|nr:hypothetical protein [Sphingomonadales bacterium]
MIQSTETDIKAPTTRWGHQFAQAIGSGGLGGGLAALVLGPLMWVWEWFHPPNLDVFAGDTGTEVFVYLTTIVLGLAAGAIWLSVPVFLCWQLYQRRILPGQRSFLGLLTVVGLGIAFGLNANSHLPLYDGVWLIHFGTAAICAGGVRIWLERDA